MKGILHEDIRQDRQKKGFNASMHSLFNFKDKDFINFIMEDNYVLNLVPKNFLEKILKKDVFDNDENKIIFIQYKHNNTTKHNTASSCTSL